VCGALTDTLALARETFPGKRNSLDALCERFGVSNAHRTLHGALLDAQLLAEVYLAMTRGQETLIIDMQLPIMSVDGGYRARDSGLDGVARYVLHRIIPDDAELAAHRAYLEALAREARTPCIWLAIEASVEAQAA
jgi:DNA polymerase-3 subunit epsilon